MSITLGEYVENLLKEYDYYGTRLPRIPMQIEREIKALLTLLHERRERLKQNQANFQRFKSGEKCSVLSFQDNNWHSGVIVEIMNSKYVAVKILEGSDEVDSKQERSEDRCKNKLKFRVQF